MNKIGLWTLFSKEVRRFLNVYLQTIIAPVVTTLMFFAVFALAFGGSVRMMGDIPFMAFLAPGLIMMGMAQNAFSNTSSSLMIGKIQGNIVDILMPPLSAGEMILAWIAASIMRGAVIGVVCALGIAIFSPIHIAHFGYVILFTILGCMMLGALGILGGIWAEKFDHIAAVTNFIVTPLTFLSGTFYSISVLPEPWQSLTHYNPFFYMIDGFRYGFLGQSDASPLIGVAVLTGVNLLLLLLAHRLLAIGYRIKS